MSLAAIFLLAAAPVAAEPPADNEIVVVAHRLESWRGKLRSRRGALTCRTTRSTGDRAIDAIGCRAMTTCFAPIQGELDAIAGSSLANSEKRRQLDARIQTTVPCIAETREAGVSALVASRRRR